MRYWWLPICLAGYTAVSQAGETDDLFNLSLSDLSRVKVSVASLRLESVTEAPSTVNLITPAQWQNQGADSVAAAVSSLPGVWVTPANYGGQAINLRGFYPSYRGVSTLLDGVTVNSFLDSSAFEDYRRWQLGALSQIEVIRGPGSSLYGADALRGVIALSTWAKPGADTGNAQFRGSYADNGRKDLQLHDATRLGNGNLQFAVAGQQLPPQFDLYRYTEPDSGTLKTGEYRNELTNHMAVLGWNGAFGQTNTEISLYNARDAAEGAPGLGTSLSRGISVFEDKDLSYQDRHFNMVRLRAQRRLNQQVEGECTLSAWHDAGFRDLDRTQEPSTQAYLATDSAETKNYVQCLARNQFSSPLQWVTGLEFNKQRMDELRTQIYTPSFQKIATLIYPSEGYSRYTRSAFFQTKYNFGDTNAVLGGRYDDFSDFAGHFSPRFALNHNLTNNDTLKLMLGNAFLSPTAFQRYGSGLTILAAPKLKAEQMNTYELAWVHNENKQSLALTAFVNEWKDAIVLGPANGADRFRVQYANVENSRSQGMEAEWQRDWGSVKSHLAYTRSNATNKSSGLDYTGFPHNILNFDLDYFFSGSPISIGLQSVFANQFDLREAISTDPSPPKAPSYIRFDLHANWNVDKNVALFADARNLTNRKNPVASVFNQEFGINDEDAIGLIGVNIQW